MKDHNWKDSKSSFENDFPLRKQCISCHQWKSQLEFLGVSQGGTNVCVDCRKKQQPLNEIPNLQWRTCKSCHQLKNKSEFIGDSNKCTSCQRLIPHIPESPAHSKMCVCCNELKDKSDFPISTSGEARICKVCLQRYSPIKPIDPLPSDLWIGLIIGLLLGAVFL